MKSLGTMVQQLAAMLGTRDLSEWEDQFVQHVDVQTSRGRDTRALSSKQAEKVQQLYSKHFGDSDEGQ